MQKKEGRFCEHCGQSFPSDVELRFCGDCGAKIPIGLKSRADPSTSQMQMKFNTLNTTSNTSTLYGSQGAISDHPRKGLFTFLGIVLGSATFWIGGSMMINGRYIFRPFIIYIVLLVIGIIIISATGKKEHIGRRILRFVVGTLGSIIIWLILGFLLIVAIW